MQIACIWKEICSSGAVEGLKPVIMMVVAQIAYVGLNIFFKPLADVGMNFAVLIAYRNMFSAAVMIPLALIFERATLAQNIFIESIALTSATFAAAISNIVQAVTFLDNALYLLVFYKGKEVEIWSTHVNLLHSYHPHQNGNVESSHKSTRSHLIGSSLAKMSKNYPFHYSSTALMSIMASIQSVAFALCKERDWSQWKLSWDINLFTAMFVTLTAWCVHLRGPLFVSIFNPLSLLLVALAGPLLLDEKLFLGSILGGILIVTGLYMVLWGKSKEMKMMITQLPQSPSRGFQDPFRTSQSVTIVSTSPVKSSRQNNRDAR
ncbi:unnamed protein product [Malus baccata var. baccata]